jgi:hypothetical protein
MLMEGMSEINVFFSFRYRIFYVSSSFVTYLLTLPCTISLQPASASAGFLLGLLFNPEDGDGMFI